MTTENLECIFLAGAPAESDITKHYGVQWRSDVPLGGQAMSQWVLKALRQSGSVTRIITVGPEHTGGDLVIAPEKTFLENMMAGVRASSADMLMICSSDIPLIRAEAFADLVKQGMAVCADFIYPIIPMALCNNQYPQFKRTSLTVKEGAFTGGNAVLIRRDFALAVEPRLEELYQMRKQPLKLANLIGIGYLARVILAQKLWAGAISIPVLEAAAGRVVNGVLRAIISPYPGLGEDVDKLEDFAEANKLLSHASRSST